jgi:hypothetical protein
MKERLTGVEPASRAWEARVIPLYDSRDHCVWLSPHVFIGYCRASTLESWWSPYDSRNTRELYPAGKGGVKVGGLAKGEGQGE